MIGFRYLLPAEEEMTEAAVFYEGQAGGLGTEFLDDLQRAVNRLRDNPKLGQKVGDGLRRSLFSRFPYSVIYTVEPECILVVAVANQRRRPNYWRDRIDR